MAIRVDGVYKTFDRESTESVEVLSDVSFTVADGETVGLVGPNGCGKSTLLNIVSGIESASQGRIVLANSGSAGEKLGYMYQDYAETLLPWRTSVGNVSFAFECLGIRRAKAKEKARECLRNYQLEVPWDRYIYQLSSGQQQKVALAMVLAQGPRNILLDEPFSAFDQEARLAVQRSVTEFVKRTDTAGLVVTHDLDEALFVSDRVFVLSERPASIVGEFSIGFEHPRERRIVATDEFGTVRQRVLKCFLEHS